MKTQLDKSWYLEAYGSRGEDAYASDCVDDYLQGASDFQQKAIKELGSYLDSLPDDMGTRVYAQIHRAIEIIKTLKAD